MHGDAGRALRGQASPYLKENYLRNTKPPMMENLAVMSEVPVINLPPGRWLMPL